MSLARIARPALASARAIPSRPVARSLHLQAARPAIASSSSTASAFRASTARRLASSAPPSASSSGSAYARFKALTKTYGSYAVAMYLALSSVDFTLSFLAVHAVGLERVQPAVRAVVRSYRELRFGGEHAAALEAADDARRAEEAQLIAAEDGRRPWYLDGRLWAEATLAYAIHKVGLLPVRAGLTVAWTPGTVRWLAKRGWIRGPQVLAAAPAAAGTPAAAVGVAADKVRAAGQRVAAATAKAGKVAKA